MFLVLSLHYGINVSRWDFCSASSISECLYHWKNKATLLADHFFLSHKLTLFSFSFSPGVGVADQLLCDGAGQHCVGPGALQWPEGGENVTELLSVHRSLMGDRKDGEIDLQ